ncbi:hypothetical protein Mapa_003322 [Marchantia paleacea]|nr:hypothetical protein Mapa_003322 [Marchantia paleacea]
MQFSILIILKIGVKSWDDEYEPGLKSTRRNHGYHRNGKGYHLPRDFKVTLVLTFYILESRFRLRAERKRIY